jgi:UDP-sugar pyrophosphorylase
MTTEEKKLPTVLRKALTGLTPSQEELARKLCSEELGQSHLFETWSDASPSVKRQFASQLEELDKAYTDGGLEGYIKNAKQLLENSRNEVNPLEGWEPSVPEGQMFELGTTEYSETEAVGIKELGSVGFVLVAGGLGERLGYSSIKV